MGIPNVLAGYVLWGPLDLYRGGGGQAPLILQQEGGPDSPPESGDAGVLQTLHKPKGTHSLLLTHSLFPTPTVALPLSGSHALSRCVCVSVFVLLCMLGRRDSEWPGQLVGMVAAHPILSPLTGICS